MDGYAVINQWIGDTYTFKRVSTEKVSDYTDDLQNNPTPYYLGDEIWNNSSTPKEFNFVLSPWFAEKRNGALDNYYTNLFRSSLNSQLGKGLIKSLPNDVNYSQSGRNYYPILYPCENTLNTSEQVHGYTTGMIFKTTFKPTADFKLNRYENGSITADATLTADQPSTFFIAIITRRVTRVMPTLSFVRLPRT